MNLRFSPRVSGWFAGIKSLFNGSERPNDIEDDVALDVDLEGHQLYKEDIIADIHQKLEKSRTDKLPLEQQWILNSNFLVGNQYCDINIYRGRIEQLEPVYDWLERETHNHIAPLIETRIANLKKISYLMKVKPRTNEMDDYMKADVSTSILQYVQDNTNFEMKKNTMIAWNELCGSCFWLSWWDKDKGEKFAVETVTVIGEDGVEQKREKAYYQGDIDYGLVTPYEVFPENVFKQGVEMQRYIILEQVKTVDEIYDLYGIRVKGTSVETFELTPLPSGGGLGYENTVMTLGHKSVDNAAKVITYFERPSRHLPNGKMVILIGDEQIVYYGDLPYGRIPLIQTICIEVAGQFFGKSVIEGLIPLQKAFNGCISRLHEYIKRIAIQSHYVEEGSIDIEEYEEEGCAPGACLVYKRGAAPPTPIPNGQLPSEIMQERYNLKSDMEYVAGTSQLMVNGATPSGVTSGTAIENLMEIDNTRLALTGDHLRAATKDLAKLWLEIYKTYATAKRVVKFTGENNLGSALIWSNEDINSFDIEYTTESELVLTEDVQRERFMQAYNMGLFADENGQLPARAKNLMLEFMKLGNYSDILSINELQVKAAQRENVFFENGIIPKVSEFDDHDIHIEEHMRYILQMRFQKLKMVKPEYAEAIEQHIRDHKKVVSAESMQMGLQAMAAQMPQNGGV